MRYLRLQEKRYTSDGEIYVAGRLPFSEGEHVFQYTTVYRGMSGQGEEIEPPFDGRAIVSEDLKRVILLTPGLPLRSRDVTLLDDYGPTAGCVSFD